MVYFQSLRYKRMCSTAGCAIFLGKAKMEPDRTLGSLKPNSQVEMIQKKVESKGAEKFSEAGKRKSKKRKQLSVQPCPRSAWATPKYAQSTDAKKKKTKRGVAPWPGPENQHGISII